MKNSWLKVFCVGCEKSKIEEEVNLFFETPEGKILVDNFVTHRVSYLNAVMICNYKILKNHKFISARAATKFRWDCEDAVGKYLREQYKKHTGMDLDDMTNMFKDIDMINVTNCEGMFAGSFKA